MQIDNDKILLELNRLYKTDAAERQAGIPNEIRMRALNRQSAELLYMIVRTSKAKNILEIGTSHGVSTIWLAWAVSHNNGIVTTIEIDSETAEKARSNFRKTGLDHIIKIVVADAREHVKTLNGKFDLVFLDTTKTDYLHYLEHLSSQIPRGGIILVDNAISHADQVRDYIRRLPQLGFRTITIPTGAGMEFSVKEDA